MIHVAFECTLIAGAPRRVLGRCDATASEPAAANRMTAIVAAMELAAQRALTECAPKPSPPQMRPEGEYREAVSYPASLRAS